MMQEDIYAIYYLEETKAIMLIRSACSLAGADAPSVSSPLLLEVNSMSRFLKVTTIAAITIVACIGVIAVVEVQTKIIRRAYDNLVLDNRNHYLPCKKLPTEAEASRVVEQHQDTIRVIKQVNPGFVGVDIDTWTCPGRADLVIWYASHQDRLAIERIISSDTFFGIPYELQNR